MWWKDFDHYLGVQWQLCEAMFFPTLEQNVEWTIGVCLWACCGVELANVENVRSQHSRSTKAGERWRVARCGAYGNPS